MRIEEFENFIDLYGANFDIWPDPAAAKRFAMDNAELTEKLLAEAREIDAALEQVRVTPGTDMLKARILSEIDRENVSAEVPANSNKPGLGYKAAAAAMMMSFVLGFAGANMMPAPDASDDFVLTAEDELLSDDDIVLTADAEWESFAEDYGFDDIYDWVNPAP